MCTRYFELVVGVAEQTLERRPGLGERETELLTAAAQYAEVAHLCRHARAIDDDQIVIRQVVPWLCLEEDGRCVRERPHPVHGYARRLQNARQPRTGLAGLELVQRVAHGGKLIDERHCGVEARERSGQRVSKC